jgi:RNA polymerase sigma-70 factor (ECF subfamily)
VCTVDWSAYDAGDAVVQRLMAQGEYRQALDALVRSYQHLLVRHCTAMLGNTADGDDAAQKTLLGAHTAMPHFRQEAPIRAWLFAIARNQCLKALRDRKRRQDRERDYRPPDPPGEYLEELLLRVWQSLDRLDSAERTVLLLRYETGLTLEEMAHIVGYSEAKVRRRLARGLQHLREVIDEGPGRARAAGDH